MANHLKLCAAALKNAQDAALLMGKFSTTPIGGDKGDLYTQLREQLNRRSQRHRWQPRFMPQPIEHPKKCQACSQGICLPFEVKQLLREVFNMSVFFMCRKQF